MSVEVVSELPAEAATIGTRKFYGGNAEMLLSRDKEVVLASAAGTGKEQPLDAHVYTPDGLKLMGEIQVGDHVCNPFGGSSKVLAIHPQGESMVYRLTFSCGEQVECGANHLWTICYIGGDKKNGKIRREMTRTVPLHDLIRTYRTPRGRLKFSIPQSQPVPFPEKPVLVDPYVLGVLIGDGCLLYNSVSFTSADEQIVSSVNEIGKPFCVVLRTPGAIYKYGGTYRTREEAEAVVAANEPFAYSEEERTGVGIWSDLRRLGLYPSGSIDKFVPESYKYNSIEVRMEILRGLMDTDGTVDRKTGTPSFCTISKRLAEDVRWIVESLGGACTITTKQPPKGRLAYQCWIRFNDPSELFKLTRKKERCKKRARALVKRMIVNIEEVGLKPCQCITVDSDDGLYLTNHFVVTHNSFCCLSKLHAMAEKYPGCRLLILRKTRESLTESALVTYEEEVLPKNSPISAGANRRSRSKYVYPNGSEIIVGGIQQQNRDATQKIMSQQYDACFVQEAIELTENDWENLTSRLRNFVMPYQQLMADTNPSAPTHWLKQRCNRGDCRLITSRHEDNPRLYDHFKREWTAAGVDYLARLDKLTGNRKERLRWGRWVQSEGVVYQAWNQQIHVIDTWQGYTSRTLPKDWKRVKSVDFGFFPDPLVIGWWCRTPDDRLLLYRELVCTYVLVEDAARAALWLEANSNDPPGDAVICDHDREDRATLERHLGVPTQKAWKDIVMGVQFVTKRLECDHLGHPRLMVFRDALLTRDERMQEAKKPIGLIEEMDSYIWPPDRPSGPRETPLDKNNHSCDMARYATAYFDQGVEFEPPPKIVLPEQFDWTNPKIRGHGGMPMRPGTPMPRQGSIVSGMFGIGGNKGVNPGDVV